MACVVRPRSQPDRRIRAVPLVAARAHDRRIAHGSLRPALYEVAPNLTDGTVVLDAFQLEDADSHLAGEDEEQARRFGWFPRRSTLAGVQETIARWRDQWLTRGPVLAFALGLTETKELVGGCELRLGNGSTASMSYAGVPRGRCSAANHVALCVGGRTLPLVDLRVQGSRGAGILRVAGRCCLLDAVFAPTVLGLRRNRRRLSLVIGPRRAGTLVTGRAGSTRPCRADRAHTPASVVSRCR